MKVWMALRLSRAPAAGLAAVGVLWGGIAALMPDIKAAVGATDAALGMALLMSAVGAMLSMLAAPWAGRVLGRAALPVMGCALALVCLLPMLAGSVAGLAAVMLCLGMSVSMLDITANVQVSMLETRHRLHLMNLAHAMFSFAFAVTAFLTGLARAAGWGPGEVLPLMALAGLGLVLLMRPGPSEPKAGLDDVRVPRRPPWGAIGLTGLVLFAAFIGENATEAWSALHIERTLGAAPGEGSFGPAMLGLMMGLGRLAGQVVAERLGAVRLIVWSAICGVCGALVIAAAVSPAMALAGVAVTGLGMAVIVPSVNSILGAHVPERQRAFALSRAWMFGFFGFFVGPAMMGGVAELFGLRVSFVVVAGLIAVILPSVLALERQPKAELGS